MISGRNIQFDMIFKGRQFVGIVLIEGYTTLTEFWKCDLKYKNKPRFRND